MTREEAIYCMKSYIDDPNYEHCTSCPYYGANQIGENIFVCNSGEAHKMAVEALEQKPNKWIPVEKELPKKRQHVLVSLDSEYVTEDYFAYSTEWFDSFINSEEKVVAWMPLPKPYKVESEDNKYQIKVVTHGNCMICGKELSDGVFFCKECEEKAEREGVGGEDDE